MPLHALKKGALTPSSTEMPMIWRVKQYMQTRRAPSTPGVQGYPVSALGLPCELTGMAQLGPQVLVHCSFKNLIVQIFFRIIICLSLKMDVQSGG